MNLEENIQHYRPLIKQHTINYIRQGLPFQYITNLCLIGQQEYDVPMSQSLVVGVNVAMDYYNDRKTNQSKVYGLFRGAEAVIRYVNVAKDIGN